MRILIIEDDPDIADGVATALRREGQYPEIATTGTEGEAIAASQSFGLILLDLMLPGRSGQEVCRALRRMDIRTPIIMMTARDAVPDRVEGLDAGADDYIVKPFAVEELLARIRAVGRRESSRKKDVLVVGEITVDTQAKTVTKAEVPVHLTAREFELLVTMARNPGRVYSREFILENVWNTDEALPNTVNFHMSSLRKKIDPDARYIKTVHGMGYVMESPES